ncbi:unnamed protein product [Trifolium pratense]|uniref:Uncharacterized protein n=1 Tax=Trifolium pratense TaxID=57577 RepID=A0ACB0LI20_TRIPR|nr:unnamed protein product [Trifolium pratense]
MDTLTPVSGHICLSLNKTRHKVWMQQQYIFYMSNKYTKFWLTTMEMLNCIHHTLRIRFKYNMIPQAPTGDWFCLRLHGNPHLYYICTISKGGLCHDWTWCCCSAGWLSHCIWCTEFHSSHSSLALILKLLPCSFESFQTLLFRLFHSTHSNIARTPAVSAYSRLK